MPGIVWLVFFGNIAMRVRCAVNAAFNLFGDAIGEHGLAIWFTNKNDEVDVRHSKLYLIASAWITTTVHML